MTIALVGFAVLLALAFLGLPLAFAMLAVGGAGLLYLRGFDAALSVSAQWIIDTATNDGFSIIPLFVLMGAFIHRAGLADDLFDGARAWLALIRKE